MLHRGSGLGSRSSSTTSLTNLANSSLHMAASLRIRDSPPKYPTSPTYPAPQRGSPTRSPLPPIPSTPPPPARVSTASLASDGRSRSDTGSVRAEGSRYFDAVGQGLARGEREDTYHGFDADDGGRSDNSSRTGSERSESDDDADDYDEEERRRRREQPTDEIGFAAGKFTIEAEPAFLPAKGTAGAAGPGAGPEAGAGPFAIGRMDLRDIGRGKGAPVPGDIGGMGSRLSQGRVRSAAGGGAGLMSASQVLTRPPGPSSMIAPPRNPAPQSGLPTAAASAKPAMTTTTSRHTYRESSAQGTRAQPHTGGDSPNEATTSENSVGSSYSDLSGV
ncbi:hypothetical protein BC938DRAFT_477260 [Jimgerdemannia flammicorona]|nr:hypothetical protein BC938DRAFT_477260 [Jimgerdemannia flammicorona]